MNITQDSIWDRDKHREIMNKINEFPEETKRRKWEQEMIGWTGETPRRSDEVLGGKKEKKSKK